MCSEIYALNLYKFGSLLKNVLATTTMNTHRHNCAMAHVRRALGIMNKRRQFGATVDELEQIERLGAYWDITRVQKEDAESADVCPICLDIGADDDNWVSLSCCHRPFHAHCIAQWLQRSSTCAWCKRPAPRFNQCKIELQDDKDSLSKLEIEVEKVATMGVMTVFQGKISKCQGSSWGFSRNYEGKRITFHHMHGWHISSIEGARFRTVSRLHMLRFVTDKGVDELQRELETVHSRSWALQLIEMGPGFRG